jgi:hypothetical protein
VARPTPPWASLLPRGSASHQTKHSRWFDRADLDPEPAALPVFHRYLGHLKVDISVARPLMSSTLCTDFWGDVDHIRFPSGSTMFRMSGSEDLRNAGIGMSRISVLRPDRIQLDIDGLLRAAPLDSERSLRALGAIRAGKNGLQRRLKDTDEEQRVRRTQLRPHAARGRDAHRAWAGRQQQGQTAMTAQGCRRPRTAARPVQKQPAEFQPVATARWILQSLVAGAPIAETAVAGQLRQSRYVREATHRGQSC